MFRSSGFSVSAERALMGEGGGCYGDVLWCGDECVPGRCLPPGEGVW